MYVTAASLDDLLHRVFAALLKCRTLVRATRGECREINGVLLKLTQPRARLSRSEGRGKPFSALGELLWYLSGSNDLNFISYYVPLYRNESEDGKRVRGAYGPRLVRKRGRGQDQIRKVIDVLGRKPTSRRAVIQILDSSDLERDFKEIPCTCTLQFLRRGRRLHMITYMRSNDALLGLPHDVFAFTMLQELVARSIGVEPGVYSHAVGSLHLYTGDEAKALRYLDEGWQSTIAMPPMPPGDPWPAIASLLRAERRIRRGEKFAARELDLASYWTDIVRLLQAFKLSRRGDRVPGRTRGTSAAAISRLRSSMVSNVYDSYLLRRQELTPPPPPAAGTLDLFPEAQDRD